MLVDLTQGNFTEPFDESIKKILPSIIAKCIKKSEEISESDITNIKATTFYFDDYERFNSQIITLKFKKDKLDSNATYKINVNRSSFANILTNSDIDAQLQKPILYFSSEKFSTDSISDDGFIKRTPNGFFIFPELGLPKPKDFALNAKCQIIPWNSNDKKPIYTTLGGFCEYALDGFKNFSILEKDKSKPQEIAKHLGYEIPDNYAPGQGVEMKKKA